MKYLSSARARERGARLLRAGSHDVLPGGDLDPAGREFISGTGLPPTPIRFERAWISVFRPGAQDGGHSHDASLLSATCYVAAPGNSGHLAFADPVNERRAHRAFTRTNDERYLLAPEVAFEPQAGRLIMFESRAQHSIHCKKSDETRISAAFDLTRAD